MIVRPLKSLEDKVKYQQATIDSLKVEREILLKDCDKYRAEIQKLKEMAKC
ncbi:hypothetical protein [Apilactobacillus xinyiensis]|uniref:hypothetical protein n=1 Tax=Apilactobacillus xinyiensis TaxID=2841032 RepID=UPI00200D575B|nr:hypothetical protein [Apilactobacillus xinyiensis]MCL0330570.1 hypothetical protein [Apilactobacillus xinyiensis]